MIPDELSTDLEQLKNRGFSIEIEEESPRIYIIFKEFPLPTGFYNMEKTDLIIFTTNLYPNAGFDMFWVDEKLTLKNGSIPRNGNLIQSYLGKNWRRFSYHPYQNHSWNPSIDNVINFVEHINQRLIKGD